jgi:hypothetical protein
MSCLFPKVCSLDVQRPGRAVRFVSVADWSNANSQYVAGPIPDEARKHLVFDTSRSIWLRGRSLLGTASKVAVPVLFGSYFKWEVDVSYKIRRYMHVEG